VEEIGSKGVNMGSEHGAKVMQRRVFFPISMFEDCFI
jgi:hypothetical protein